MSNRIQMTFTIGSNEEGQAIFRLLEEQQSRLGASSLADTLRIALFTLASLKDSQIVRYFPVSVKKDQKAGGAR